jgi:hypothetical protein
MMLLIVALAEREAFAEAHELLRENRLDGTLGRTRCETSIRHARAQLYLAEGAFDRAHAEACDVGALREAEGRPKRSWTPWRSIDSLALAHIGRREQAVVLADAELALAERFDGPVPIARALHACGRRGRRGRAHRPLRAGDRRGRRRPWPAPVDRARLELGSTLARVGRRVAARDALRPALAGADAVGAVLAGRPRPARSWRRVCARAARPSKGPPR